MNCEVLGPLIEANNHWLLSYYNKMNYEKTNICSNIITSLPPSDLGGPGLRISTYNFLLKINQKIMYILTKELIINRC